MQTYELTYQSLTSGKSFTRVSSSLTDLQKLEQQLNMEGTWLVELFKQVPIQHGLVKLIKV